MSVNGNGSGYIQVQTTVASLQEARDLYLAWMDRERDHGKANG